MRAGRLPFLQLGRAEHGRAEHGRTEPERPDIGVTHDCGKWYVSCR